MYQKLKKKALSHEHTNTFNPDLLQVYWVPCDVCEILELQMEGAKLCQDRGTTRCPAPVLDSTSTEEKHRYSMLPAYNTQYQETYSVVYTFCIFHPKLYISYSQVAISSTRSVLRQTIIQMGISEINIWHKITYVNLCTCTILLQAPNTIQQADSTVLYWRMPILQEHEN